MDSLLTATLQAELASRIAALEAQLEEARKDARRLDSGVILMHERDEFGEDYTVEHRGVNLRAAIDSAMAADGGGK